MPINATRYYTVRACWASALPLFDLLQFDLIQTDEAKTLVQQGLQADGEALGGIGGGFVHVGDDDVAAVDVLEAGGDGVALEGGSLVGVDRETGDAVAQAVDFGGGLGIVDCGCAPVPVRGHAKGGGDSACAAFDFLTQMDEVWFAGDAINLAACADDCRDMVLAVVFDIKEIKMRLDLCHACRVAADPALCGKDGGGDALVDQKADQIGVVMPGTGIQRQGNLRRGRSGRV